MDDVTDVVFRQVIASTYAPDIFFTEFVNVDGLQSPGREALLPKLKYENNGHKVIAQIWRETRCEKLYGSRTDPRCSAG